MVRLLFLLGSVVFSTSALQCYMTQSSDPNYIPSRQELGLCPASSIACFRTILNTTYQGFQVTGARYGCDSPSDSVCQDAMNPECQFSLPGTCCCHADACNQLNGGQIIIANGTTSTTAPGRTTPTSATTGSLAKTTPHGLRCYAGDGQDADPLINCLMETTHCFNMTANGTRFRGCDDGNQLCNGTRDYCMTSDDGSVFCCCTEDYCNGNGFPLSNSTAYPPPPNTPATANDSTTPITNGLICYNGLANDTNYTPYNVSELETCSQGTKQCYIATGLGQTMYSCDDNHVCQSVPPESCKIIGGMKLCCCAGNYCNGSPYPGSQTTSSPPPAIMACYSGENSNVDYYPGYNEIQQCLNGITTCYRTFLSNILYYGCDNQNHCQGIPSGTCVESADYGRICCCDSELCNGHPFGDNREPPPKSAYAVTLISTVLTIIVHNFV